MADKSSLKRYILKNSRTKERNLKYDFMPSLLEIIERPAHVAGKVIIIAITALLIVAVVWSYFAKIDIVVSGSGAIVTEADKGVVTALSGGVVEKLYVAEGDYVKSGDVLLKLDTSELDLNISQIEDQLDFLRVQRDVTARFMADANAEVYVDDYDEKYRHVVNDIIYENDIYRLQADQTVSGSEMLDIQYQASLNEELLSIDEKIRSYEEQLERYKLSLENMVIEAPVSGYVLSSSVSYEGQVISGMQEVFIIVPDDSKYVFEGYISDKDIADISVGDSVQIKLQSYSYSDYGAVTGTLSYISPSSINIEGTGNVYKVNVEIDEKLLNKDVHLVSGLSGTMEINVGKRRILDYFLDPILGSLDNSLKEK